jgi:transcription antitermination protein NusB
MAARHRSRQRALQVLYQWDVTKRPMDEAIRAFYDTLRTGGTSVEPDADDHVLLTGRDEFMEELARGASQMADDIDHRIAEKSAHWKIERMPIVDRNILRLGIYEMSRRQTPPAVVIDEALELARPFSGAESVAFINGVLDAVHKEIRN